MAKQPRIRQLVKEPAHELDELNLHAVVNILEKEFPSHSLDDLARHVAEVAVIAGWRYLVWFPPED